MSDITLEEVLELVTFERDGDGELYVVGVRGNVWGNVEGNVRGSIVGSVSGDVDGNIGGHVGGTVGGDVKGNVYGTINRRKWQFVETKQEKAIRLIQEGRADEAIKVLQECE